MTETTATLSGEIDVEKAVQASLAAGVAHLRNGDVSNAHRHLDRALSLQPQSPEVNNAMAMLYRVDKDFAKEREFLELALKHDDSYSPAQNNFGALLYREGQYAEAITHLEKAAKDIGYDKRWQSFLNMGFNYAKLERYDEAEDAFKRAVFESPSRRLPLANLELAEIALKRKQYAKAEKQLAIFTSQANSTPKSLWIGIRLQRMLGDKDKLASYELKLRQLFPESKEFEQYNNSVYAK